MSLTQNVIGTTLYADTIFLDKNNVVLNAEFNSDIFTRENGIPISCDFLQWTILIVQKKLHHNSSAAPMGNISSLVIGIEQCQSLKESQKLKEKWVKEQNKNVQTPPSKGVGQGPRAREDGSRNPSAAPMRKLVIAIEQFFKKAKKLVQNWVTGPLEPPPVARGGKNNNVEIPPLGDGARAKMKNKTLPQLTFSSTDDHYWLCYVTFKKKNQ